MAIEVGDKAPDFTLPGRDGEDVSLSSYAGKQNVVLVFYPLAFSPVCQNQLTEIGGHSSRYADEDAAVIGVSVDSHYAQTAFADALGVGDSVTMAADFEPKGAVAKQYGTYMEGPGISGRATFVIDREGTVQGAFRTDVPTDMPDEAEYFTALGTCSV